LWFKLFGLSGFKGKEFQGMEEEELSPDKLFELTAVSFPWPFSPEEGEEGKEEKEGKHELRGETIQNNSLDRYFTKEGILKKIAWKVSQYLTKDFLFVDFSCGDNKFVPLLGCDTMSFDISSDTERIRRDWFTVKPEDLHNKNLAIGLNPPFGYQGSQAKKFIQHSLLFSPKYFFLILPNMKWKPQGYQIIYREELPQDSFYDPETRRTVPEICADFYIFAKDEQEKEKTNKTKQTRKRIKGVTVTRKFEEGKYPIIILRRVGRNTTKQFYCLTGEDQCTYIEKGERFPGVTWVDKNHKILSDFFLKIYFEDSKTMEELIGLCDMIYQHPEDRYERKQPHAITNEYVLQMIEGWLK